MPRLTIIVLLALSGMVVRIPAAKAQQPLLRLLFLDLPVEQDIQEIVKEAEQRKGLDMIECIDKSYCFQLVNHPILNLNDFDNHFVINGAEHRDMLGVKLWI